ncbi:MAG TPA: outer membrane beta-barrel protein [Acetobacteraceae bacterium]|nr:outer membrane beta-barrel protein [Acetobacteraceae bacterium]
MIQGTKLKSGMLRAVLGVGTALSAVSVAAIPAAHAFNPPSAIKIDGGPLGTLQLSGGADGYGWAQTGTGSAGSYGLLNSSKSVGVEFMNGLVEVQKSDGLIQGTIELGSTANFVLGYKPNATSVQTFSTGPLYAGYITLAPSPNFSISAGHLASLEGYESGIDWNNFNVLTTDMFEVENSQSTGVSATGTVGPVSGTITFGDGFDTQLWNYLQLSATYTFNSNNVLTLFGSTNLGTTGAGAHFYGSATTAYNSSFVGSGPTSAAPFANSSIIGGYYSFTAGNLNIVPEVQYVWAKKTPSVGLTDFSSNLGIGVFANYQFGTSPYSLGGWVQYFTSNGADAWFLNPGAQGYGISITPTWQGKYLFLRGDVGLLHLTQISNTGVPSGYNSDFKGRNQATFLIEAGLLF